MKCLWCAKDALPNYSACEKCKVRNQQSQKRRYDRLRASGLCYRCKKSSETVHCAVCTQKLKKYPKLARCKKYDYRRQLFAFYKQLVGCCLCGYDAHTCVLQLHHLDPQEKEFDAGSSSYLTLAWNRVLQEVLKTVVLCANCHKLVHAGLREPVITDKQRKGYLFLDACDTPLIEYGVFRIPEVV